MFKSSGRKLNKAFRQADHQVAYGHIASKQSVKQINNAFAEAKRKQQSEKS